LSTGFAGIATYFVIAVADVMVAAIGVRLLTE
jgi:hypothetical protein